MHFAISVQEILPCQLLLCKHPVSDCERKRTNHIYPIRLNFHMWLLEIPARLWLKKDP